MTTTTPPLPVRTQLSMLLRLLAIQGSWNYETLIGTGIGFCVEPALRLLPGGRDGEAYRAALARQTQYFNAHPYLAAVAVGALGRAELDGEPAHQIERYRRALCSPLGSLGDRLVWSAWLPFCSIVALALFAWGAAPLLIVLGFLALYNAGHLWLLVWGLRTGWRDGLRVAPSLGTRLLRQGPTAISRAGAALGGLVLPVVFLRIAGGDANDKLVLAFVLFAALIAAALLLRLHGRLQGWKAGLIVLSLVAIYSAVRS
jgi:mannose PTS system EIID component